MNPAEEPVNPASTSGQPLAPVATRSARRRSRGRAAESAAADSTASARDVALRFNALVSAIADTVWTADTRGMLADSAGSWCAFTGQPAEEAQGAGWLSAVHPDDRSRAALLCPQALASGARVEDELRVCRADGEYRWLHVCFAPFPSATDEAIECLAICRDITEERAARDKYRLAAAAATRRANELEAIFEAMTDAVVVFDTAGNVTHFNEAATLKLGMSQACVGQPAGGEGLDLRSEAGQPLPDERRPMRRILNGETLSPSRGSDVWLRLPNRHSIQLNVTGGPVRDEHGAVVAAVARYADVTERRKLERRTHAALQALLAIVESLVARDGDGAETQLDGNDHADGQNTSAQRLAHLTCHVMGCDRASLLAINADDQALYPVAVVGLQPEHEREYWQSVGRVPLDAWLGPRYAATLRDGNVAVLDLTRPEFASTRNRFGITTVLIAPVMLRGTLIGILALDHDGVAHTYDDDEIALAQAVAQLAGLVIERDRLLAERAQAQASALAQREVNRRMDEFLSMASHELRNPLTSIKANTQLAMRLLAGVEHDATLPEAAQGKVQTTKRLHARSLRQTDLMNRLVGDLLDVSRIQTGKLEIRPEQADLVLVLRDAVEAQRLSHPDRIFTCDISESVGARCAVTIDGDRIGQVVTNFLTNAVKYTPPETPIHVRLEVRGQRARVEVEDHGPGLPAKEIDRVWTRFHRVAGVSDQTGSGVGLGLGLFISRSIIERHGGEVGAESEPGQGATFWFSLPVRCESE